MSDIYGNNPSTGGFQNPAIENLDMSTNYKIVNLKNGVNPKDAVNVSQLTSSNPFNQSLNTYNDVQFQNVNMNGNWNIPNTQPASINDPNLYIISAQGGLVTIPAGPSFTIKTQMIASPQVDVVIPIPHMAYSYLDLCQLIQNSYNTNAIDVYYRGTMTICQYGLGGYLIIEITRELIHLSGTFIIVYDGPNTPSAALGYTATFTTPCNSIAVAQSPLVFSTFVGWKALGSSTTPITNGSPYTYSSSQDKWYTNELLYSDNFLNYFSQNNTEFTINQNGFTKFIMNEDPNIGTSLWGPSGSGRIELVNSRINLRQNSKNRFVINNAETYSFSPSLLNYSYKSDTEFATFFNSVNRFSIDLTNSLLCSPNLSNNINVTDSAISLSNTSSLNKLTLSNIGLVYAFNNVAKMIMNANNFVIANGTTNRLDINGTDSKVISASGNNSLYIGDTAMTLTYNAVARILVNATNCNIISPTTSKGFITVTDTQTIVGSDTTSLKFEYNNILGKVYNNSRLILDLGASQIYSPNISNYFNTADSIIGLYYNFLPRFTADSTSCILKSPDTFTSLNLANNNLTLNVNSINREIITNLTSSFYSPSLLNSIVLSDNGNILTCNGSILNLNNAYLSYTLGGIQRTLINSTYSRISSPDGLYSFYVANTGASLVYNGTDRIGVTGYSCHMYAPDYNSSAILSNASYIINKSTIDRLKIDAISSSLNYNDTNYVSINNSNIYLIKNNVVRTSISDTLTNTFSPSNIMNTVQTDTLYTISGGSSTGTSLTITPTDISFNLNNILRIHSDNSHSQLLSPDGTKAIEANNTGVQINLGSDNYKLPTTRGTVGQVLTYSGINTTWATPSPGTAVNAGWAFLPMSAITATATAATRSFYYISMVPLNTVITGIKAYINTTGADFINCAIYRGKNLVVGSTLVMTSGRVTVLSTVDANNYMTLPLILQAGQSATFSAGEYVTICFHSSGSGAVYYICAAAPANLGISYISTACYAAAGTPTFPANLSLITPSTTNTIRTHFEFY